MAWDGWLCSQASIETLLVSLSIADALLAGAVTHYPMVQMVLGEVKKLSDFNPASLHQSLKIHPTSGLEGEGPQGYA